MYQINNKRAVEERMNNSSFASARFDKNCVKYQSCQTEKFTQKTLIHSHLGLVRLHNTRDGALHMGAL